MPFAAGLYYFAHQAENISRPPVILIHGAGGSHLNWPPQVRRLEDQRMLALDLPGHGKSEGVGRQSIAAYAAAVVEFMDALKLPAAVLAGHSLGAGVALVLALDYPHRVLGLALVGSSPQLHVSPALLQAAASASTFREAVKMVTAYSYSPQADARLKELGEERMAQTRSSVFLGDLLACDAFDVSRRLSSVSAPTLIIAAELDKMTPLKYSRVLQEKIAGSQLHVLPGAGHMMMLEQPAAVACLLADFLGGLPDRKA